MDAYQLIVLNIYVMTKRLLEEAIQHAVNHCQNLNNNKISNFIILLCNSICVKSSDIKRGIKILKKNKKFDTVTTVQNLITFLQ